MPRIREKPELGKIDTYTKKLPALSYVFKEFSPSFFFFGAGKTSQTRNSPHWQCELIDPPNRILEPMH